MSHKCTSVCENLVPVVVLNENASYNDLVKTVAEQKNVLKQVEHNGVKGYFVNVVQGAETGNKSCEISVEDELHHELSSFDEKIKKSKELYNNLQKEGHGKMKNFIEKELDIDFQEVIKLVQNFRERRMTLGLTQFQVASSYSKWSGRKTNISQVKRFESLDMSVASVMSWCPRFRNWLEAAEETKLKGNKEFIKFVDDPNRRRRRVDYFKPEATKMLLESFESNPNPSNKIVRKLSIDLDCTEKSVSVWFEKQRISKLKKTTVTEKHKNQNGGDNPPTKQTVLSQKYVLWDNLPQPPPKGQFVWNTYKPSTLKQRIEQLKRKTSEDEARTNKCILRSQALSKKRKI